jgi:hypothetical protein
MILGQVISFYMLQIPHDLPWETINDVVGLAITGDSELSYVGLPQLDEYLL